MGNARKDQGDRAERAVVNYLQPTHQLVRRTKAGGEKDLSDVVGFIDRSGMAWAIQVADRKWTGHQQIINKTVETAEQADRLGVDRWVMIAKRPKATDVGDWFAWLPTWMLMDSAALCNDVPRMDVEPGGLACVTVYAWLEMVG